MKIAADHTEIIEILMEEIEKLIKTEQNRNPENDEYKKGYSRGCVITLELIRTLIFNISMNYMHAKYGTPKL